MDKLGPAQAELERLFNECNRIVFAGSLPQNIVVSIQTRGRKKALAWYAPRRWKAGEATLHEINFCAEHLADGRDAILERMIHEMVHAQCGVHGIQDCSKSGHHNKKFKRAAEDVGLTVEKGKKGWAYTKLGTQLAEKLLKVTLQKDAFDLCRIVPDPKASLNRLRKWVCGCNRKFWAKTDMNGVKCEYCQEEFTEA